MTDTATSRYGARKQGLGDNVNTWGDDKLNTVIDLLDRGSKGYQSIALTGDLGLTWNNYSATNDGQVQTLRFTGSLSSAATVTMPSREWAFTVINASGQTVTVKTSAGTGVAIQNGYQAALYCDGTDVKQASPTQFGGNIYAGGQIGGVVAGTTSSQAVNKGQLDAAIAAATTASVVGTVKVDSLASAQFLIDALLAGTGITITDGGDDMTIAVDFTVVARAADLSAVVGQLTATISAGTTAMTAKRRYRITAAATGTLPTMVAGDFVDVEMAVSAGVTATIGRNAQTIDGAAADDTYTGLGGDTGPIFRYSFSAAGAVKSELIGSIPL